MEPADRKKLLLAEDEALWETCAADFRKGTGNGGQKLNKTSSAVRIFHPETGITVNSLESRSQSVNRHLALKKLRFRIACSERCPAAEEAFRLEPAPSVSNKIYPQWIALMFDHLAAADWDLKKAAPELGTSRSKLTKLLQRDDALWREFLHQSAKKNTDQF